MTVVEDPAGTFFTSGQVKGKAKVRFLESSASGYLARAETTRRAAEPVLISS